ncbi:hypothetical protein BDB00DRAFT_772010 [Zychaea mexicana]|uniref:uncharacterized protein n=1 Tax=Zychaea mexicana TaxID=64656 RepID=UPI0022FE1C0F|nr:uncharacterized protein BDB00DRAFT_772010 [Zychaea mexicana]KAI9488684.1 hypothetical protein BDB00DRAFT_772010 [Zychaea mexicana]
MHSYSVLHCVRRSVAKRFFTSRQCKPTLELDQLYKLATIINGTSSTLEKAERLLEYPACHDILRRIYDPHLRHYISSRTVLAHIKQQQQLQTATATTSESTTTLPSLEELLDALSSRRLSGKAALNAAATFYSTYCKTDEQRQIFCRILDRNLKMGMSVTTIQRLLQKQNNDMQSGSDSGDLQFKSVALASTAANWKPTPDESNSEWYASRKLDGVRCIAYVRDPDCITFYSRTGRVFHALQKVRDAIRSRLLEDSDHNNDKQQQRQPSPFVLDGEICVFNQDSSMEDFLKTLRQIRTLQQPMENPVYEVFDMVGVQGFREGKDLTRFKERQERLAQFIQSPQPHLRMVEQIKVDSPKQLAALKSKAVKNGWEGLILRKNVGYEGKRSRNMLKIKEWEDNEYTVKSIETGRMRLATTGQDTEVMTSVVIEHKGNFVSVGSGFTLQQRIRYFRHPELIIGKPITVRYFSESMGESGQTSLRFPTVKAVYEEGKRTV